MKKIIVSVFILAMVVPVLSFAKEVKPAKIPSWVRKMRISGDARLRAHLENLDDATNYDGEPNLDKNGKLETLSKGKQRGRMRFRIKMQFKPSSKLILTYRLSSDNITMGEQGAVENKDAFNDLFYFLAKPVKGLKIWGGRFESPFEDSGLVWDSGLKAEGMAEMYTHSFGAVSVTAGLGEFILRAPKYTKDFLDHEKNHYLAVAKLSLGYKAGALNLNAGAAYYNHTGLETAVDYNIINPHFVLKYKVNKALPLKLYGEFSHNSAADDDANAIIAGVSLGKTKKAGSYKVAFEFRRAELNSEYEDSFSNTDFGAATNVIGFHFGMGYAATNYWILEAKVWNGSELDDKVGTPFSKTQVQLQTVFKF